MASLVQLLRVRVDGHVGEVCDHVSLFRHDHFHTDVVLRGSDRSVLRCHRLVLASISPLFAELLALHAGDEDVHLLVPQASSHVLSRLLDFCYSGRTLVEQCHLQSLIEVATCLGIKFLKDVVVRVVKAAVKRPNKGQTGASDKAKIASGASFAATNVKYDAHETHNYAAKLDKYARKISFNASSFANMGRGSTTSSETSAFCAPAAKSSTHDAVGNTATPLALSSATNAIKATSAPYENGARNVAKAQEVEYGGSGENPKNEEIDGSADNVAKNDGEGIGQSNLGASSSLEGSSDLGRKLKAREAITESNSLQDQNDGQLDATSTEEGDNSSRPVKEEAETTLNAGKTSSDTNKARSIKSPQPSVLLTKTIGNEGAAVQQKILLLKTPQKQSVNRIIVPASSSNTTELKDLRKLALSPTSTQGRGALMSPSFQVETLKRADGTQITFLRQVPNNQAQGKVDIVSKQAFTTVNTLLAGVSDSGQKSVAAKNDKDVNKVRTEIGSALVKSTIPSVEDAGATSALKVNGKGMSVSQPRHIIPTTLPENFLADDEPAQDEQSSQLQKPQNEQDSLIPTVQTHDDANKEIESNMVDGSVDEESVPWAVPSRVSGRLRKGTKRYNKEGSRDSKSTKISKEGKTNIANKVDEKKSGGNEAPREQEETCNVPPTTTATQPKVQHEQQKNVVNRNEEEQEEIASTSANLRPSKRRSSLAAIEKMDSSKRQRKSLR